MATAPEHALATLSGLLLIGGGVASVAYILAGFISDYWIAHYGSRRAIISIGLVGLLGSYGLLAQASSVAGLAVGVVCFQLTLNLMFGPLGALMTDYIPDARKGRVAGWLNAGLPLSALMVTLLSRYVPRDSDAGFFAVAAIAAAMVIPLLVIWPFAARLSAASPQEVILPARPIPINRRDLIHVWAARLSMQLGASILFNYIYVYLASMRLGSQLHGMPGLTWAVGLLSLVTCVMAMFGAVIAGHGSDANGKRRFPMVLAAIAASGALLLLAYPQSWGGLLVTYGLFQAALTAYLAIDTAMVAQLLAGHPRRGAYLGFMNLTNTLPGVFSAMLALLNVARAPDSIALSHVLLGCAIAAFAAAILVGRVRSVR